MSTPAPYADAKAAPRRTAGLSGASAASSSRAAAGSIQQRADVGAGEPAGNEPEGGQRGVASADVGVGLDDQVAGGRGVLVERRFGIGDDDQVVGWLEPGLLERVDVGTQQAVGFDRAARLAGDDDDGFLQAVRERVAHHVGMGGVEHRQGDAGGGADDLRRE